MPTSNGDHGSRFQLVAVALENAFNESQPLTDPHVGQEDQARVRCPLVKNQRAEVLVQGHEDTFLRGSKFEEFLVAGISLEGGSLEDIVTVPP